MTDKPKFLFFFWMPVTPRTLLKYTTIFILFAASSTFAVFFFNAIKTGQVRDSTVYFVINITGVSVEGSLFLLALVYLILSCKGKFPAMKFFGIIMTILSVLIFLDEIANLLWLILVFSMAVETEQSKMGARISTGSFVFGMFVFVIALASMVWQIHLCYQIWKFHAQITDGSMEQVEPPKEQANDVESKPIS